MPLLICSQVWDVRKTISPVREFVGHSKGFSLFLFMDFLVFANIHKLLLLFSYSIHDVFIDQVSLLCPGALMTVHSCLHVLKTIERYAGILLVERYITN